jgi:hypothetical protein
MAKKAPPHLTPEGLRALKARLDRDLKEVKAPDLKQEIEARVTDLQHQLDAAATILEAKALDVGTWSVHIAPAFAALAPLLKRALGLARTDQGACKYQGGCIVTTATQCTVDLKGEFHKGVDCSGNPLP